MRCKESSTSHATWHYGAGGLNKTGSKKTGAASFRSPLRSSASCSTDPEGYMFFRLKVIVHLVRVGEITFELPLASGETRIPACVPSISLKVVLLSARTVGFT